MRRYFNVWNQFEENLRRSWSHVSRLFNLRKTSEEEVGRRKLDGKSAKDYGFIWRLPIPQFQNLPNLCIKTMQCREEEKIKKNKRILPLLCLTPFFIDTFLFQYSIIRNWISWPFICNSNRISQSQEKCKQNCLHSSGLPEVLFVNLKTLLVENLHL